MAFAFTFFFLITAWVIYTTFMSVLPQETRSFTFLNIALLLLVSLVPFLLNSAELGPPEIRDYASTVFALDLTGMLVILGTFAHVLGLEEKRLVAPEAARLFRNGRNRMFVLAGFMALSIAPVFWEWTVLGVPVRLYMWCVPLVSYWAGLALRPASRSYKPV